MYMHDKFLKARVVILSVGVAVLAVAAIWKIALR